MKNQKRNQVLGSAPVLLISVCFCLGCSFLSPGCGNGKSEFVIMSWNVENLFDDINNGTEYSDYIPGEETWTSEDFHGKMASLAQGVQAAVRGGPDVLLLQEVENINALTLFNESYLKGFGYRYLALQSSANQAVAPGILSRYPFAKIFTHEYSLPESPSNRIILEVWIEFPGETAILFNNHWKSKLGGAEATEPVRREAAALLNRRIGEIRKEGSTFPVIIAGDLNEDICEYENNNAAWITALMEWEQTGNIQEGAGNSSLIYTGDSGLLDEEPGRYFSPWPTAEDPGSYFYNNSWERIDHFLLTREFFDDEGLKYLGFKTLAEDFLLYPGGAPIRWDKTRKEGFSDHLALILTIEN